MYLVSLILSNKRINLISLYIVHVCFYRLSMLTQAVTIQPNSRTANIDIDVHVNRVQKEIQSGRIDQPVE